MVFNINDTVRDTLDDMGVGVIVDTYINRHDDPDGITVYVVDFDRANSDEEVIFDRFAHEIELHVVKPVTITIDLEVYNWLIKRNKFLEYLEASGVDKLDCYKAAQEIHDD